jgi:hypothetical protein
MIIMIIIIAMRLIKIFTFSYIQYLTTDETYMIDYSSADRYHYRLFL